MGIFDQNRNSSGRGFGGRLILALIIAAMGYFLYWNQVEVNPITGEKQHVAISPDQEIRLGLASAAEMAREMGGELPADHPKTLEVKKIGNLIVSSSKAKNSPWKFQFHLLADDKTVNAFALPGGQIFITQGLLDKLLSEAQLAGVLAHEMGHVIERHTAEQMAKSQLGQLLIAAVATGASDSRNSTGAYGPMVIASVVNQMFQLRYSRQDESEADQWGIKLMSQAGFNPRAMIEVMVILKASSQRGNLPDMFQTHPDPDLRIKQIKAYLLAHPPETNLIEGKKLKSAF